jgi:radical SAM superfamily enzyme YgiQ (UPF0313 family)
MKVTFIRPNMNAARSHIAIEPLVFAILAGQTPQDVERVLYDERLEDIPLDEPTDLAAITVASYTARRSYEIATAYRQRGVPVVMGGFHPTFLPEEALLFADAVAIGDAEDLWPQIVRDAQRGRLQRMYAAPRLPSLAGRVVDRSLFAGKRYSAICPVQYGRGCRYACDFCSIHAFYGAHLRQRPLREFVAEVEALDGRPLLLVDDNLFVDVERAEALFQAMKPLGARWFCQVSIDVASNEPLLDLMVESGCVVALIGFESLDPANLKQMGKQWNLKHGPYEEAIRRCRQRGLMVYGTFVFGYDQDRPSTFDATVDFAIREKLSLAEFYPLTPMPGARLYDRLRSEGRLLYDRWWLDPAFRYGSATFVPRGMTADELTEGCFNAGRRFNSYGSIFRRALKPCANSRTPRHLGAFLGANLVMHRAILRRQGMPLGTGEPLRVRPGPIAHDLHRRAHEVHAELSDIGAS